MKKKIVRDFRPYEAPLITTKEVDIATLVGEFVKNPSLHHVCVIDKSGRLLGLINRKKVFKHLFFHHVRPDSMVRNLLDLVTAESSTEMMLTHFVTCKEDDNIDDVIKNLIEYNIREIPVVDDEGRVLGFITILMIMKSWLSSK